MVQVNLYNFFSLSVCFTLRHRKRLGEILKLSRVSGASRSRPASRKLQCLVSAQKVSCTSLHGAPKVCHTNHESFFERLGQKCFCTWSFLG